MMDGWSVCSVRIIAISLRARLVFAVVGAIAMACF